MISMIGSGSGIEDHICDESRYRIRSRSLSSGTAKVRGMF